MTTIYCIEWFDGKTWLPHKPEINRRVAVNMCRQLNSRKAVEKRYRVQPYGAKAVRDRSRNAAGQGREV